MPVELEEVEEIAHSRIAAARRAFAPTHEEFATRLQIPESTIRTYAAGSRVVTQKARVAIYNETGIDVFPSLSEIENAAAVVKYRRWRNALYFALGLIVIVLGAQYHLDVPIGFEVGHNLVVISYVLLAFFAGPLVEDLFKRTYLKERRVREMLAYLER